MKTAIVKTTWGEDSQRGWGNGYVIIPKGHELHGVHYGNIAVQVHWGLTYSSEVSEGMIERMGLSPEDEGKWCIGFDTAHLDDCLEKWPKEEVQAEADRLKARIEAGEYSIYEDEDEDWSDYEDEPEPKPLTFQELMAEVKKRFESWLTDDQVDEHYSPDTKKEDLQKEMIEAIQGQIGSDFIIMTKREAEAIQTIARLL